MCYLLLEHRPVKIDGFDIDPVSVKTGEKAIYSMENGYKDITDAHKRFLLVGNGKTGLSL